MANDITSPYIIIPGETVRKEDDRKPILTPAEALAEALRQGVDDSRAERYRRTFLRGMETGGRRGRGR